MNLAIGLPLRNSERLDALLRDLYDPSSPGFRHYLTPSEFAEQFGPSEQDYQAVMEFARRHGFKITVTHSNRVVLDVEASVSDIENAFHIKMLDYQHPSEARVFHAPDTEPSLDLTVSVLYISGLNDFSLPHPMSKLKSLKGADMTPKSGSASGAYIGDDFRAAYVPGTTLTGSGQTVGLLQFDGFYASDITAYETKAGRTHIPLQVVPIDGGVSSPGSGGEGEVCLDIEMIIAMSPGVSKIYVYEAPNPSPWVDLLNRMANDNLSKQLSCSWGGGGPDPTAEQIFRQMAAQGQSFFNATGDSDAFTTAIEFPSDSTNVVQVGGTTLATAGPAGAYSSETVWNWGGGIGSSGGSSTYYAIPGWQKGISMTANKGSTTMRNVPDVALTGDNVYVTHGNGANGSFGGTSCAAPLWAAYTALVNQMAAANGLPAVGFPNPMLYSIGKNASIGTSVFHDITVGNNESPASPGKYTAVPGYDLCTGWGTPTVKLISVLAVGSVGVAPASDFMGGGPPLTGPYVPSNKVYTVMNLSNTNFIWTISSLGGAAWLNISTNVLTVAPNTNAPVVLSINQAAASLMSTGLYVETVLFTNAMNLGVTTRKAYLRVGNNYSLQAADYNWVDPVSDGHSPVDVSSNVSGVLELPFNVRYYDGLYSNCYMSAHGMMGFFPNGLDSDTHIDIPDPQAPNGEICALWGMVDGGKSPGAVYFGIQTNIVGVTTNRKAVLTWLNVPDATDPSAIFSFQVIIPENSGVAAGSNNDILVQYKDVAEGNSARGSGKASTIGIEDENGVLGVRYSYDGAYWLANQRALLFTQSPVPDTVKPVGTITVVGRVGAVVTFEVKFSETVTGLAASGLTFTGSTSTGIGVGPITGGGMRYLVAVTNVVTPGRIQLGVLGGAVHDVAGNLNDAFGPAVFVVPVDKVDFFDDMELGIGDWTVSTGVFAIATQRAWEWGVPDTNYPAGPSAAYSGTHCWGTVLTGDYPNSMDARLTSSTIEVGVSPTLDFYVWYDFEVNADFGYVEVFDGSGWRNVTPNVSYTGPSGGWIHQTVPLDDSMFGSRAIQVRFRATSDEGNTGAGMYVDDVKVTSTRAPGLWVFSYSPTNGTAGTSTSVTFCIYNSGSSAVTNAFGDVSSPDPGVTIASGSPIQYGLVRPGDVVTSAAPVVLQFASGIYFDSPSVTLFHQSRDGVVAGISEALPFTVNGASSTFATNTLTVRSLSGVTNWMGRYLQGNGGVTSCIFQVIYAGTNGVINLPLVSGQVTGDDRILYSADAHQPYGRIGEGQAIPPNVGAFLKTFSYSLPTNAMIYVRAWDASSFEGSVAYGDSALYSVQSGSDQLIDLGSWCVGTPTPGSFSRDSNGDSIPDGWCVLHGLDPRAAIAPLGLKVIEARAATGDFNRPSRVAVSSNYVFVADTYNSRIQVWNRDLTTCLFTLGSSSDTNFSYPNGITVSRDGTRVAVADTLNHRVRVFSVNPTNGVLSSLYIFGSRGSATNQFYDPVDVAFDPTGRIFVADSKASGGNNRVQIFDSNGNFLQTFGTAGTANGQFGRVLGLGMGADGTLYAADGTNNRVQVFTNGTSYSTQYGTSGTNVGQFNLVWDAKPGLGGLIYVTDFNNNRIQVLCMTNPPAITLVGVYADAGSQGAFRLPQGAAPAPDDNVLYVADTGNSRVLRLRTVMDSDGDGMDDVWEVLHGLNPNDPSDALSDPDGDGVSNIGEYRAGTDPNKRDTNGNGASDGWELLNGLNPTVTGGPVINPPTIQLGVTPASPVRVGQVMHITATASQTITNGPFLALSGGVTIGPVSMSGSGTAWQYDYKVPGGVSGAVNGAVSGAIGISGYATDPMTVTSNGLFIVDGTALRISGLARSTGILKWNAWSGDVFRVQTTTNLISVPFGGSLVVTSYNKGTYILTNAFSTNNAANFMRVQWINAP